MKTEKLYLGVFLMLLLTSGCKKENEAKNPFNENLENGVLIVNQGSFGKGDGDLSFYNRETKKVTNTLFQTVNGRPAGDVVQSVSRYNGKYYIVANASGKIEIAEEGSFKEGGVIKPLYQPRYFLGISPSKAYVTEWGTDGLTGTVAVIQLSTLSITKRINVGKGPERMLQKGTSVYVACSGGYGTDSTVFIINTTTDEVTDTIRIEGAKNPNSMVIDTTGMLIVLCGGKMASDFMSMEVQPALVTINPATNQVMSKMFLTGTYSPAGNLCINKEKTVMMFSLLFGNGIYSYSQAQSKPIDKPVINAPAYALGIDPKNNDIYAAKTGDGSSPDWVFRYNAQHQIIDSFQVGLFPGFFLFNQ